MTKEARISSISFSTFGKPSLSVGISTDGGYTTFTFKDERLVEIEALLWRMIEEQKKEMAQAILNLQTPLAIAAPSSGKVIDADDETPF